MVYYVSLRKLKTFWAQATQAASTTNVSLKRCRWRDASILPDRRSFHAGEALSAAFMKNLREEQIGTDRIKEGWMLFLHRA